MQAHAPAGARGYNAGNADGNRARPAPQIEEFLTSNYTSTRTFEMAKHVSLDFVFRCCLEGRVTSGTPMPLPG